MSAYDKRRATYRVLFNVNIVGSTKTYKSLQSAYNSAKDGNMIQSRAVSITENVDFNLPKMMTIRVGIIVTILPLPAKPLSMAT